MQHCRVTNGCVDGIQGNAQSLRKKRRYARDREPFGNRDRVDETVAAVERRKNFRPRSSTLDEIGARLDVAVGLLRSRVELEHE